jgi:hypothetical protein
MADIFCDFASGDDADDGSTRALAKKTLAAALTAAGAGGRIGVKSDHAESQASAMALTSPGTDASPVHILCIDWSSDTVGSNALTTGATVTTTGNSSITFAGVAHSIGVTYSAASGAVGAGIATSATSFRWTFENGALIIAGTGAGARIAIGAGGVDGAKCTLINTNLKFAAVGQSVDINGIELTMIGGSVDAAGSIPTTLFSQTNRGSLVRLSGVDLSAIGSGKNLFAAAANALVDAKMFNCKLGSSVAITTGSIANPGAFRIQAVNNDSADTNIRYYKQDYQGTITQESTIVRTGGASDGTTPISRKMVTTANSKFYSPLVSDPIDVWNETLSALTATVEVVTDNVTLTDAEAWLEVEYLGTSGFPISTLAHDRASNILSTPANQTSSAVAWTTTGLGTPVTQKLSVTFTPAEKGWIRFRVHLAKASTTMYFCPEVDGLGFTSGRQWQGAAYINEGASGGAGGAHPVIGQNSPVIRGVA